MSNEIAPLPRRDDAYRGVPRLLHAVRWAQHVLAIVAEVLILLSFAMSGMDVSLGGVMANVPLLKILWAGMFALGIDTAFVLSWVRVRQSARTRHWLGLSWNILLASGMSIILFQPVAVQLLQQALSIDFTQALNQLGINIVILTYARAAVAVFLGAILAMTNVESEMVEQPALGPKRRVVLLDNLLNRIAPVVTREEKTLELPESVDIAKLPTVKLPTVAVPEPTQLLSREQATAEVRSVVEQPQSTAQASAQLLASNKQQTGCTETTPEERLAKVRELNMDSLGAAERVTRIVALFPDMPDRELGRLSGVSAATAKKYRSTVPASANLPIEG